MEATDVVEVMDALDAGGVTVRLDGGWAVDALLGEQTRAHADLDVIVDVEQVGALVSALASLGFEVASGGRDVNFVCRDGRGREVDVHAVRFDPRGNDRAPSREDREV